MNLKRMAVVAAAAVAGPTVLMATPAMADEVKNPAVSTPDAEPKGDPAPEAESPAQATADAEPTGDAAVEAKSPAPTTPVTETKGDAAAEVKSPAPATPATEPKGDTAAEDAAVSGPELTLLGLPEEGFKADRYSKFVLHVDNKGKKALSSYDLQLRFSGTDHPLKGTHLRVETIYAGVWKDAPLVSGPGEQTSVFDLLSGLPVAQDQTLDIPIGIYVSNQSGAMPLRIEATGTNRASVTSQTPTYMSKIFREEWPETAQSAPKLSLDGLPRNGFEAGDRNWRELKLKVDNSGRSRITEFNVNLDLISQGVTDIRPNQMQVEILETTGTGQTAWRPVKPSNYPGSVTIFHSREDYQAGEQREIALRVKFNVDTPETPFSLNLTGYAHPHEGGPVARMATYYSSVAASPRAGEVEGGSGSGTGTGNGGQSGGGNTGNQPRPDGGGVAPVVHQGGGTGAGQSGGATSTGRAGGQLAATGADPATSWALGGAGLAVALGAALVAGTGKRRRPTV